MRDDLGEDYRYLPPSQGKIENATWYFHLRNIEYSDDDFATSIGLWIKLRACIAESSVDRDDAHEMVIDFSLSVDYTNPYSVIGALKYREEVNSSEVTRRNMQIYAARRQLINGCSAYYVQEQFNLYGDEFDKLTNQLQAEGYYVQFN